MSIAVLLPHFNNQEGLDVTLSSLAKEKVFFELFLIDDGSSDTNLIEKIVEKYRSHFTIHLYLEKPNRGITSTLNSGLSYIQNYKTFRYVARIDAGDINLSNRLQKQSSFLDKNPEIGLLAAYVNFVDEEGRRLYVFKPVNDHEKLRKLIHVYNPFIHPVVMMRLSVVEQVGLYPTNYDALEDHAYFMILLKHTRAAILEEPLLDYELNPNGISLSRRRTQTASRLKLFYDNYYFGWHPTYGLLRAILTKTTPRRLLTLLKKSIYK